MSRARVTATIRARAPERFGPALRRIREARGLTQEQVAEHLGVTKRVVRAMELGEQHGPRREAIVRLGLRARLLRGETLRLLAAAALDRGAIDVSGLVLEDVERLVEHVEGLLEGNGRG